MDAEPVVTETQGMAAEPWIMRVIVLILGATLAISLAGYLASPLLGLTKVSDLLGVAQLIIGGLLAYLKR